MRCCWGNFSKGHTAKYCPLNLGEPREVFLAQATQQDRKARDNEVLQ